MDRVTAAADAILAARLARSELAVLPAAIRPRDEGEAFAVRDRLHMRLPDAGFGPQIGWKIGCTTPVMQDYLGIRSPVAAGLFAAGRHASGAVLRHRDYRRIGVECEIAVRLGANLAPMAGGHTAASVAPAVDACMAAIEIVDDRYADWRTMDAPTLIADDFFSAGCVLGALHPPDILADAQRIAGRTLINAKEAGRGRAADVMGHPLNALAWLAGHLGARGGSLRRGDVVLTGSLVETRWLAAGDRVEIAIDGLGAVSLGVD